MNSTGQQNDPGRPIGKVTVSFENGGPAYDIVENYAYNAIDAAAVASSTMDQVCVFLYHGSLAICSAMSYRAVQKLGATAPQNVFIDVNLRSPWWQTEQMFEILRRANCVELFSR